jgi:kexin
VKTGATGKWHNWQLLLWGSSIDAYKAKPHPLPGTDKNPSVTTALPVPHPTATPLDNDPDKETAPPTSAPTLPESSAQSGFWPWSLDRKWIWLYGSIATILLFVSGIGLWYGSHRRKTRILETRGVGREDYEFEMLRNDGDDGTLHRRAGELYDALTETGFVNKESEIGETRMGRPSGEAVGDREMVGFLADSDDDEKF